MAAMLFPAIIILSTCLAIGMVVGAVSFRRGIQWSWRWIVWPLVASFGLSVAILSVVGSAALDVNESALIALFIIFVLASALTAAPFLLGACLAFHLMKPK